MLSIDLHADGGLGSVLIGDATTRPAIERQQREAGGVTGRSSRRAVRQCQALQRQTQEGDSNRWGSDAVPAWYPQLHRQEHRHRTNSHSRQKRQCMTLKVVKHRLQRWDRDTGLVAEVHAVGLGCMAWLTLRVPIVGLCLTRPVVVAASGRRGLVMRHAPIKRTEHDVTTKLHRTWRQTRIGNPGTDAKKPQEQHTGCPAAKLSAVLEHQSLIKLSSIVLAYKAND